MLNACYENFMLFVVRTNSLPDRLTILKINLRLVSRSVSVQLFQQVCGGSHTPPVSYQNNGNGYSVGS